MDHLRALPGDWDKLARLIKDGVSPFFEYRSAGDQYSIGISNEYFRYSDGKSPGLVISVLGYGAWILDEHSDFHLMKVIDMGVAPTFARMFVELTDELTKRMQAQKE
jgi:hypothetical protein